MKNSYIMHTARTDLKTLGSSLKKFLERKRRVIFGVLESEATEAPLLEKTRVPVHTVIAAETGPQVWSEQGARRGTALWDHDSGMVFGAGRRVLRHLVKTSLLLAGSAVTLILPANATLYTLGSLKAVGFGDVTGDGQRDVVLCGPAGSEIAGYINVGRWDAGGTASLIWSSTHRMVDDNSKVWLADVNGDGRADLVAQGGAGSGAAGWVCVGLSNGTGFAHWSWTSGGRMVDDNSKVWLADVNADGRVDLVAQGGAGGGTAGWICVGLSNGIGFTHWSWTSGRRMVDDNSPSWLADVNGDGRADLITQGGAGGGAAGWMCVGLSNGYAFTQWSWTSGRRMVDDNSKVWLADVNGDGRADLVAQGGAGGGAAGWICVGLGNGLGFAHWSWTSARRMVEDNSSVWLADLNADGRADLVTQAYSAPGVYIGYSGGYSFGWWSAAF